MIVIFGLVVLLVAAMVGIVGVLSNAGPGHTLTANFSVLGYHVTGSTGTLFFFGMVVGAVTLLGLSVLLAGARRSAGRGHDARRALRRPERETVSLSPDRDALPEHQRSDADADLMPNPAGSAPARRGKVPLLGRWLDDRPTSSIGPRTFSPTRPILKH